MHPEGTSEALGAWRKAAGLRQPHVQIQPHDRSRCHLMQVHLEQTKDVHHHGIQGYPKAGGEQVMEDNHFVGAGMSNSLTHRRSADIVSRDEASTSQVIEEGWSHFRQA